MRYDRLYKSIVSELREDFKRLSWTVKDCPFNIHMLLHASELGKRNCFLIYFSLSKQIPFSYGLADPNVIACMTCHIMDQLVDGKVLVLASVRETSKKEFGYERTENDYYSQRWRHDEFLIECAAAPMWNLLERSIDFDKLTQQIAQEVMDE